MMAVEEMSDVLISGKDLEQNDIRLRTALARAVEERLPQDKELVRVVAWSPNGGGLYAPPPGSHRFEVAYEVRLSA